MIKIALVDDHTLFRSGLKSLLSEFENFEVVLEAGNGQEFLDQVEEKKPDIVLLDLEMPVMDGMQTIKTLKERNSEVKAIIVSMHQEEKFIVHLMELGARGYLLKNANSEDIENAICSVAETGYFFSEMVSRIMLHGLVRKDNVIPNFKNKEELTKREIDVLKLICKEHSASEIGELLFISPRTVEGHRTNIMEKIGARNVAGIVVYAMKNGIYDDQ